jgi:microcystin-dependent protein
MSEPFLGEIIMFGGNFAPRGWAKCQGQLLSIVQNTALFSILGTTYGGDGQVTFGLPDMQGRSPIGDGSGPGLSPAFLGEKAGVESTTLTINQMPIHNHAATIGSLAIAARSARGDSLTPESTVPAIDPNGTAIYSAGAANVTMAALTGAPTINTNGGSQSFSIRNPYTCVTFIIALEGVFPSRN